MGNLTVAKARALGPGRHGDGDGLYLLVKPSGARTWVLRVQLDRKRRDIGLGAVKVDGRASDDPALDFPLLQRRVLTLEEARDKAAMLRGVTRAGLDPLVERDRDRRKLAVPTFAEAVRSAHDELKKGWSDKLATAFKSSLEAHAIPVLGALKVDAIEGKDVVAAIGAIWSAKPEQARKVRQRIMQVLAFAHAKGWRAAPLPDARIMGKGLAKQPKGGNYAALPYAEVPAFVVGELGKAETVSRLALLFAILTAARSGEVRHAAWEHIDLEAGLWKRPAAMMKMKEGHTVTLSNAAIAVLERAAVLTGKKGLVFPSVKTGKPLSDMTLSKLMRTAGSDATVHGFRSSFRDWAAEKMPTVPAMVAEMALAHSVGSKVEQAYLRSDLLAMRMDLLDAWGRFAAPSLVGIASNVVAIGVAL